MAGHHHRAHAGVVGRSGQTTGDTDIFITPGFQFKVVDALITNFHLPKSTLMMLVSALAGYDHIRRLYAHAIAKQYRFFSYGDAMWLPRTPTSGAAVIEWPEDLNPHTARPSPHPCPALSDRRQLHRAALAWMLQPPPCLPAGGHKQPPFSHRTERGRRPMPPPMPSPAAKAARARHTGQTCLRTMPSDPTLEQWPWPALADGSLRLHVLDQPARLDQIASDAAPALSVGAMATGSAMPHAATKVHPGMAGNTLSPWQRGPGLVWPIAQRHLMVQVHHLAIHDLTTILSEMNRHLKTDAGPP